MRRRDPKINPKAGDEITADDSRGNRIRREVTGIIGNEIYYWQYGPKGTRRGSCQNNTWRRWCQKMKRVITWRGDADEVTPMK